MRLAFGFLLWCVACKPIYGPRETKRGKIRGTLVAGLIEAEPGEAPESEFDRIARGGEREDRPSPAGYHTVALPGGYQADFLADPPGWTFGSSKGQFIAVRNDTSGEPAMLFVATEAGPRPWIDGTVSDQRHAWQSEDARLGGGWHSPLTLQQLAMSTFSRRSPETSAMSLIVQLLSPAVGRGLGYDSHSGEWDSWRWIGRNDEKSDLRISRSRGLWVRHGGADAWKAYRDELEEALSYEVPKTLRPILDRYEAAAPTKPASTPVEATEWAGRAGLAQHNSMHFALLCRGSQCPYLDEVARLVDSLAEYDPTDNHVTVSRSADDVARDIGLLWYDEALAPTEKEIEAIFEEIVERAPLTLTLGIPDDNLADRLVPACIQSEGGVTRLGVYGELGGEPITLARLAEATWTVDGEDISPVTRPLGADDASMAFVLDYSGSMSEESIRVAGRSFLPATQALGGLSSGAVVRFADAATLAVESTSSIGLVAAGLDFDPNFDRGLTALYDGIAAGVAAGSEGGTLCTFVVVNTDGLENASTNVDAAGVAKAIRDAKASAVFVGTFFSDTEEMEELAGEQGVFLYAATQEEVHERVAQWVEALRGGFVIEFATPEPPRQVSVSWPDGSVEVVLPAQEGGGEAGSAPSEPE